jgi:methionyl-tRNA formyltransferase
MAKILLLGMGPTASSALESLVARFVVAGLVREARSPAEGGDEVVDRARRLGVPDCTVVSSYNRVLLPEVLDRGPFLNVHYAPLPRYRGRANVNWAIINGEPEAAITIHVIAPGLDSGNIVYQQKVAIGPHDTVGDVYDTLNKIQRDVLAETVARYLSGYEGEPQDDAAATYGCGRVPDDGEIDWSDSTKRIYALVRALAHPYPEAHTYLNGRRISVVRALPLENVSRYVGRIPGRVVGRSSEEGHVDVLTGDGTLRIYEVRVTEAAVTPASRVIGSTRQTLGLRTADLLTRIELLEARLSELGVTGDGALSPSHHVSTQVFSPGGQEPVGLGASASRVAC